MRNIRSRYIFFVFTCFVSLAVMTGCNSTYINNSDLQEESDPSSHIKVNLFMSEPPLLNEPAEITCTLSSPWDFSGTDANILLPEGAALVDGDLIWHGDLKADTPVSFSATIIFNQTGKWTIEAGAQHQINEDEYWGGSDFIYVNVGSEKSEFGWATSNEVPIKRTDDE